MTNITIDPTWNIKDVYEFLMRDINEDLLPENLSRLDTLYAGETEKERKTRYKRYGDDLRTFLDKFETFLSTFNSKSRAASALVRKLAESYGQKNGLADLDNKLRHL